MRKMTQFNLSFLKSFWILFISVHLKHECALRISCSNDLKFYLRSYIGNIKKHKSILLTLQFTIFFEICTFGVFTFISIFSMSPDCKFLWGRDLVCP